MDSQAAARAFGVRFRASGCDMNRPTIDDALVRLLLRLERVEIQFLSSINEAAISDFTSPECMVHPFDTLCY